MQFDGNRPKRQNGIDFVSKGRRVDQTPKSLPQGGEPSYGSSMEARVAVLELIAKETRDMLVRIDSRMDRMENRIERVEDRQSSDFKWLLGFGIGSTGFLFATMAHGFHWL
jgi:hypothetical protein